MKYDNSLRIIIIDDSPEIHQVFLKILTSKLVKVEGEKIIQNSLSKQATLPTFEIDTALQGQEGVEKIKQAMKAGKPYALAFVDITMPPGWGGVTTIKHIWEIDPSIEIVICTANSDYTWEETVTQLGERDNLLILKKPFDVIAVKQLAYSLTKKWQLMQDLKLYMQSLEQQAKTRTESLKKSLSVMRATLESSTDGVLVVDNTRKVNEYNQKFIEMFNMPKAIVEQEDFNAILGHISHYIQNSAEFIDQLKHITQTPTAILNGNLRFDNGNVFEYYTQPYTLNNEMVGRVWSFRDVSQRAAFERELLFQATHDLLTGLPNRLLMHDAIKQSILDADKHQRLFAVLFIDLDRFKLINDSLNHKAGDTILRVVAKRFLSVMRSTDTLIRLGGDEFLVIVNDVKDKNEIITIAKKLTTVFEQPFRIDNHEIMLTISIGICVYPTDEKNIELLLSKADSAMYHSKELGANQFQFYTEELNKKNLEKLEKEADLRRALVREEFFLYYQPQFDLSSEKIVSMEALIRWRHPEKGILLPLDFIPLAEETGLIIPIGEWVLRTACQQAKTWQNMGFPPIRMAVNITTKQFRMFNLVQVIEKILTTVGLDPKYLELELTENMVINNTDMLKTVHDLKKMGVQIALDDFGTGYSSLNYLREIPVDRLKIDQSYVQNIESDRGDDVIIQAIIAMAKSLKLEVLAEGVETKNQLEFLKKNNCEEVAGFYFSEALSAKACEKLLKKAMKLSAVTQKIK